MKRKLVNIIPVLLAAGMVLPGCTKLDSKVYNQVLPSDFFKTPQQTNAFLAQAYTPMTNMPCNAVFQNNEVSTDEMVVPTRGNDWYDGGKWQSIWQHTFVYDIDNINNGWGDLSNGIGKCNLVLETLSGLPASNKPANADQVVAEIKVLRAYYYFMFMDMFGNVPLVTDFKTDPTKISQSTRKDVYAFLESELTTNVPLLADKSAATYGHMTKWGGYMLLAKLYLNAQVYTGTPQWQKAADAADMVIKSGQYTLTPDVLSNFVVQNENSTENIFVVPFDNTFIGGNSIELFTLNYNNIYTYDLTNTPYNGFCAPQDFFAKFSDADKRKKMWAIGQQYSSAGAPLTDKATGLKVIFSKYVRELSNPADSFKLAGARSIKYAPQPGTNGNTSNDGVIFRLADAYLMKAEALMRLGQMGDALPLVNAIRTRSGVPAWTVADLTFKNLLDERGREMAWEGWRRNDLIRFEVADGIPYFTGARIPGKAQDADQHTFIYPIPQAQLITNPKLTQNPGYSGK
ncbi:RagB/SusD family nutrient uptake outer membrane protein [Mucilaginibacter sp. L3T2-6]|uniref:RagB/SusD family nutrient uptake outer membrane protein n=1 Tax=Mucilaginibacter sp. L3T2-6 TaxID=3062491 RepID=UPI0026770AA1|nr:RagB/SusD family nutrient uptake outer membrane protein [Mucilaginibacter sp. L3T2-6]MDO3645055.1 RagB/SusD family nutrient uptake outer membrane protein [Mucilaginibacter sp. L3T2-6]MDV6217506.1 RagB/SusD family nutrient uptake outer membrane protein [Mucilaginibacter sp. L3T2-6]